MNFKNIDELLKYTEGIKGKTFKDFDVNNVLSDSSKDKGILGKIIETGFYKYPNNNKAEADFADLGVELKVSGYIKNKNGTISAKERLVLGKIDYNAIIHEDFNFSHLIFKSKKILIIWYEYDKNKTYKDFVITDYQLYDMTGDSLVIKNDYEVIKRKVIEGKAHLLSEGDTSYLGACTKGATGKDKTKQPNSDILAKPRAFSLKNSYMTGVLRSINLVLDVDEHEYKSVEEYVFAQIEKFIGKTQAEIYAKLINKELGDDVPKNLNKMLSDRMIGKDSELPDKSPLFSKVNYYIKNLPIDFNGYPIERMSFRNLRLSEFEEEWENSDWKTYFEEITIIVICYRGDKKSKNGERILEGIKKISFTPDEVELFGRTYNKVRKAIITKNISLLPQPKDFEGQILEVAPKGGKDDDAYNNFFKNDVTKVCFMLDKEFLFKKLCEDE
jgi:DNA mismatch repair protein MutH